MIVVGAPYDDDDGMNSGSVGLFSSSSPYSQLAKLTASDAAYLDEFGTAVAVTASLVVVGAPRDDDGGSNSGSVYLFSSSSPYSQLAKITASDAAGGDDFGSVVAVSDSLIVVGAPGGSGSVYLFLSSSPYSQLAKLTASDAAAQDSFGTAVAVTASLVVVGAPRDDDGGSNSGSVYLFSSSSPYSQLAKITASDAAEWALFGIAVAVSDSLIVVGASRGSGSVYLFSSSTHTQLSKITASDAADGGFGFAIAVSASRIYVATQDGDEVYIFSASDPYDEVDKLSTLLKGNEERGDDGLGPHLGAGGSIGVSASGDRIFTSHGSDSYNYYEDAATVVLDVAPLPPPSSPPSAPYYAKVLEDPHMTDGRGGRFDFRGKDLVVYNLLTTQNTTVNALFKHTDFRTDHRLIHDSFMTAAYVATKASDGRVL